MSGNDPKVSTNVGTWGEGVNRRWNLWRLETTDEIASMRREKGRVSFPRRRWAEMSGHHSEFENVQYPKDVWQFLFCRFAGT